jgi:sarcosine oxidase subunit gamma
MSESNRALTRRPALARIEAASAAPDILTMHVLSPHARFSLRLDPALIPPLREIAGFALGMPINRRIASGEIAAIRLGPDEWLLSAPESATEAVARDVAAILAGRHHALADVSHRYVGICVAGTSASDVLNSGCPLDLSPRVCTAGFATRTLLGKAEIILAKTDDAPTFEIACARSFAAYVRDFLLEATRELR